MPKHVTGLPVLVCCAAVMLLCTGTPARAETAWVVDELIINFRTLPSSNGRIAKLLPSGTPLEIVERQPDGEYVKVRTRGGDEGWVLAQYLQDQPIAAVRLEAANREVEQLTRTVTDLRQRLENVQSERSEAEQSSSSLASEVSRLEQELAEIRRVSSGAMETAAENQRLSELNARLRGELDELVEERDQLAANTQERWLLIGGGLVLGGLILGMIIKARPRRSAWT